MLQMSQDRIPLARNGCGALFGFLCLLHYFSPRPLWLDENFILQNLRSLSAVGIFGPLDHAQAFPRVYLLIVKWISQPFGYAIPALRISSLICMLAAYVVWGQVFKKVFGTTWSWVLALFTFTCSYHLSYYASEFKPYAMDVLVAGVFARFLLKQKHWTMATPSKREMLLTALLPLTLFFSYAGVFLFWIVILNLLFLIKQNRRLIPVLVLYSLVSLACLALIYIFDIRHSLAEKALLGYWDSYFLCRESVGCFMETFWEGVRRLSTWWFGQSKTFIRWGSFLIPFVFYGLIRHGYLAWGRERGRVFSVPALTAVLFSELVVFGFLRLYPFTGQRITLFFAPLIFCVIIRAIDDLKRVKFLHIFVLVNYLTYLAVCYVNSVLTYARAYI